jgi:uncharacterized membrane protein (UPF0127 family)
MLILFNESQNKEISEVSIADSYFKRLKGLMLKRNIKRGLVLKILSSKYRINSSIHMCFMLKPLDVLFIDEEDKIYEMAKLRPWQIYTPEKSAKYIAELEENTIKEKQIKLNDKIIVKKKD